MDNVTIFNMRKTINIKFRTYGQNVTIFNIRKTINIKFRTYGQNVTIFNIRKTINIKFRTYGHYVKYTYGSRQFCKEGGGPYLRGFRIFFRGGSWTNGHKTVWTTFFSPQLIYILQRRSNGFINYIFPRIQRGSNIFQGGGGFNFFIGGPNA